MAKAKYSCPNCGEPVLAARWDAGYEYCKEKACFEQLGRRSGVSMFDHPPKPGEVDLDPMELEEVADLYQDSE